MSVAIGSKPRVYLHIVQFVRANCTFFVNIIMAV